MIVQDLVEALKEMNPSDEVFMFVKTLDGNLQFMSTIDDVDEGSVIDEYGQFQKGVLLSKNL